jgi:Zn-dependent protease with chaperone function
MKGILRVLRFLLGLALVALFAWLVYYLLRAGVNTLTSLKSDIAVAIIAASGTIAVSIFSLVISKYLESRAIITVEIRAKKVPIYEELISTIYGVLFAEKLGQPPMSEANLMKFFAKLTEKLTIWGSDGVVKAFRAVRMSAIGGEASEKTLFGYETLLMEIRKDLGHGNKGFRKGTLLGLFVNDIDKYL